MKDISQIIEVAKKTISSEAQTITNLTEVINESFAEIALEIFHSSGRLVLTGVGKSANIANKIVATCNSTGTPALFMHAADAIHGDLGMIQKNDIVLCISKSGNTPEIKVLVPLLKRGGNKLIGMTADKNSYLAEKSDYVLHAKVEKEACPYNLAPTNSTTAQLVLGDTLAMCLLDLRRFRPEDFAKFHPGGALGKRMYLRVEDMLDTSKSPRVFPDQHIPEVILEISSKRLGATAVVNSENELLGIITDGDLRRMLEKTQDFSALTAKDIMTLSPKTIPADTLAIKAFNLMEKNNITQLVVSNDKKFVGLIHLHDLLKEGIV